MNLHQWLLHYLIDTSILLFDHKLAIQISGYGVLIIASSVVVYTLYIKRIFERTIPPPISIWVLWTLLDIVAIFAEFSRGVFNIQLFCYTIGSAVVCGALFFRPNLSWDKFWDTATTGLVLLSAIVFVMVDDKFWALIAALTGMSIASIPLVLVLLDETKEPWKEPWDAWFVILIGSVFTYLDGQLISGIWLGTLQIIILVMILSWHLKRMRLASVKDPA